MLKLMSKITDVIVSGISLVLKWQTPAVPHASTKFAILKTKRNQEEVSKLETIEKKFRDISA